MSYFNIMPLECVCACEKERETDRQTRRHRPRENLRFCQTF